MNKLIVNKLLNLTEDLTSILDTFLPFSHRDHIKSGRQVSVFLIVTTVYISNFLIATTEKVAASIRFQIKVTFVALCLPVELLLTYFFKVCPYVLINVKSYR